MPDLIFWVCSQLCFLTAVLSSKLLLPLYLMMSSPSIHFNYSIQLECCLERTFYKNCSGTSFIIISHFYQKDLLLVVSPSFAVNKSSSVVFDERFVTETALIGSCLYQIILKQISRELWMNTYNFLHLYH